MHRLIFEVFRGAIPAGMTVNHRNGIKTDNRSSNLELATMSEQMVHAYRSGLQLVARGEERGRVAKLTNDAVRIIRREYVPRKVPARVFAVRFGVSESCIMAVVNGSRWKHI